MLILDERLLELRDRAVPAIVPEVVFWQRYFGQIYRAIQYAMSRQAQQRRHRRPDSQFIRADGARIVADHEAIAAAVRRTVMIENDRGASLNRLLEQVTQQAGATALERAVGTTIGALRGPAEPGQLELTVLHWAAMVGDASKCAVLLRNGASAEARTLQHGITPLIIAATMGKVAVIELLLKAAVPQDQTQHQAGEVSQVASPAVDVNATAQGGVSAVQVRQATRQVVA